MILDHVINAYLGYFYIDVISIEISSLKENFEKTEDFDLLRKKINIFFDNVYNQMFFNYPDLVAKSLLFFDVVNTFEYLIETID